MFLDERRPRKIKQVITGWLLLFGGAALILSTTHIVNYTVDVLLTLNQKALVFDIWQTPPVPLKLSVYFFNWTNHQDIFNTSVKQHFQEIGPYVYYERLKKVNITFNNNDTVTYKQTKTYQFNPEESKNINDSVITINPLAIIAAEKLKNWSYFIKRTASMGLSTLGTKIHMNQTVEKLLFKGYEDPIITLFGKMSFLFDSRLSTLDKFGYFYGKNGSADDDGVFNVGCGNKYYLSKFIAWNYKSRTSFASGNCNRVIGTSGEVFSRPTIQDKIVLFATDLCRYITLEYVGDEEVYGITGRKYVLGSEALDNGTIVEENKCYCNNGCLPSGAIDVSACRFGIPAAMSLPHFYAADPYYLENKEGLNPVQKKHEFYVIIEPLTGVPLRAVGRMQLNFLVQSVNYVTMFAGLPKFYYPVMWTELRGGLSNVLIIAVKILTKLSFFLIGLGTLMIFVAIIILAMVYIAYYSSKSDSKREFMLLNSTDKE